MNWVGKQGTFWGEKSEFQEASLKYPAAQGGSELT